MCGLLPPLHVCQLIMYNVWDFRASEDLDYKLYGAIL